MTGYEDYEELFEKAKESEKIKVSEEIIISGQEVVDILKEKGIESPEGKKVLRKFADQCESEAKIINTSTASLESLKKIAHVIYRAGFIAEAIEELEDVARMAEGEGDSESYYETLDIIEHIKKKHNIK